VVAVGLLPVLIIYYVLVLPRRLLFPPPLIPPALPPSLFPPPALVLAEEVTAGESLPLPVGSGRHDVRNVGRKAAGWCDLSEYFGQVPRRRRSLFLSFWLLLRCLFLFLLLESSITATSR
jgi:hypothetical protein